MNKKKILIIDDEVDIANNIKAILDDENYISSVANNSSQALNKLSNEEHFLKLGFILVKLNIHYRFFIKLLCYEK